MGLLSAINYNETQELIEEIKKINNRLDHIEKKLKEQEEKNENSKQWIDKFNNIFPQSESIPDPCKSCSNHPNNGGSGICHCIVPYFSGQGIRFT